MGNDDHDRGTNYSKWSNTKTKWETIKLGILSAENVKVSVASFYPPRLKMDKTIPNLERVEVIIPAHIIKEGKGKLEVRLAGA